MVTITTTPCLLVELLVFGKNFLGLGGAYRRPDGDQTHLISSLIESWGSNTAQTQAWNGSELNQNWLIFAPEEVPLK